ncbi:MAG: hypothetical protein GY927_10765 [bacterium]|nr:hypothetical protein [bacterium]
MLIELPIMARMPASEHARSELIQGVTVTSPESVSALLSSINDAIDQFTFKTGRSSDIGLIAQSALIESLSLELRDGLPSLFAPQPSEIKSALGKFANGQTFGDLARDFFARLTYKSLDYYLSRELANHTGHEARFASDADRVRFEQALFQHSLKCRASLRSMQAAARLVCSVLRLNQQSIWRLRGTAKQAIHPMQSQFTLASTAPLTKKQLQV